MFSEFFYTLLSDDIKRSTTCEDLFSYGAQVIWFYLFSNVFHHPTRHTRVHLERDTHSYKHNVCTGVRPPAWGITQDTVFWKPSTFHLNTLPMPVLGKARFVCYQIGNASLWSAPCSQGYPLGGGQTDCAVLGRWPVYFCASGEFWIHCLKVCLSHSSGTGAGWPLQWYGLFLRHLLPYWLQAAPCWDNQCWFGQGGGSSNSRCSWILNRPKRGCQGPRTQTCGHGPILSWYTGISMSCCTTSKDSSKWHLCYASLSLVVFWGSGLLKKGCPVRKVKAEMDNYARNWNV